MLSLFGGRGPELSGAAVMLREPRPGDFPEWAALRQASRDFLEPWEPEWPFDEFTRSNFRSRVARIRSQRRDRTGLGFLIFERGTGRLAGGISIGNIRHGAAETGQIGYWMGEPFSGRGLMTEAVRLVTAHAFDTMRLHRLEAACIPGNRRSERVLEKAGFQREGLMRSYLRINGVWQDHTLYAIIAGDHIPGD